MDGRLVGAAVVHGVAETFGYPPIQFRWFDNNAVFPPFYDGIFNGGFALASFLNGLGGDNLNLIAHSHGGNVVKFASYFLGRPFRHLIHLGTPVNWDLYPFGGYAYSFCQISSYADYTQFGGASPYQVANFGYEQAVAAQMFWNAGDAAFNGDWESFAFYMAEGAYHEALANSWWLSTKLEWGAANYMFGGEPRRSARTAGLVRDPKPVGAELRRRRSSRCQNDSRSLSRLSSPPRRSTRARCTRSGRLTPRSG